MTETTPDYAELIAEAEAAQEWMRQPDWADNFSLGDMVDWLGQRPTSILPKLTTALRALLESNAALERERTNLIETKREQIGRLQKERDEQWKRAGTLARQNAYHKDRAEAAEAALAKMEKEMEYLTFKFETLKLAYDRERSRPFQILGSNAGGNDGE